MSAARLALLLTAAGSLALLGAGLVIGGTAYVDLLSWVFVQLPIAAWAAALVLVRAHRLRPDAQNLGERSIVAVRDAIVATIGALLGLNRIVPLGWPSAVAVSLLGLALLLVTAYSIAWLIQWYQGRWD